MRGLLLALLLAPLSSWAAVASGTLALWSLDNVATDSSGNGYTLSMTGTVPYVTSPTPPVGTHAAGVYGASQYFSFPAGLNTALTGLSSWTIQGYVYANTLTISPVIVIVGDDGSNNFYQCLRFTNTGIVRVIDDNVAGDSSAGVMTAGAWYFFFLRSNGSVLEAGVSPVATPDGTTDATLTCNATIASGTARLGRFINALTVPLDGYIDNVRVSNSYLTSLPTTDPASSINPLSPYIRQFSGVFVSPVLQ